MQGQSTATSVTINLPEAAENASSLQLGFRWDNHGGVRNQPPFSFDNVVLTGDQAMAAVVQSDVNTVSGYAEHDLGPNQTVYFYDQVTGNIMCSIQNGSHDFGCTKVEVVTSGTSLMTSANTSVIEDLTSKSFLITPEFNNSSASYTITLFYTAAEINGFVSANASSGEINTGLSYLTKGPGDLSSVAPTEIVSSTPVAFGTNFTLTGAFSTGFSGISAGDGASTLPISLISFDAKDKAYSIALTIITGSEINNRGFEIERSLEPHLGFEKIAWIDSNGDSNHKQEYSFEDHQVLKGITYYYRFNQIDIDGKSDYSRIVSAKLDGGKEFIVGLSPNPASNYLNIYVSSVSTNPIDVLIYDSKGQLFINQQIPSSVELNVEHLPVGLYFVEINDGINVIVKKMIIE